MQSRLDPYAAAPDQMKALAGLEDAVRNSGLEPSLIELVKIRASQINACAFCLSIHTRDARSRGESEERLHLLDAWRDSSLYTARERAALAWTEAVTLVAQTHVPDSVFEQAGAEFDGTELVKMTVLIAGINAWNRIAVSFRLPHPAPASASVAASSSAGSGDRDGRVPA